MINMVPNDNIPEGNTEFPLKKRIGYGSILLVLALIMYTLSSFALSTTIYSEYSLPYGAFVALLTIVLCGWIPMGKLYLNGRVVSA